MKPLEMISWLLATRSYSDGAGNPGPAVITDSPNKYSLLSLATLSSVLMLPV